ncbi:MAG: hypothetical protein WB439_13885 [Acidobacteriaceae bacterium]
MIDIQPPEHTPHTWRDFFIHIATIVVGLVIAVGLEQTVEAVHHHQQRQELRKGIIADAKLYLHDVDQLHLANAQRIEDLTVRIQQVKQALSNGRKLVPPAYRPLLPTNTPRLGNIEAAKSSGLLQLLSPKEVVVLTEPEVGIDRVAVLRERVQEAAGRRIAFEQRFQANFPEGPSDFSSASQTQLDDYFGLLLGERVVRTQMQDYINVMHRGTVAFLEDHRSVEQLRQAEEGPDTSAHP